MGRRNQNFEEVTVLLTQSTLSAPGVALNSEPVFNPPSEGRWVGLGVAIRSGMVPFLRSLDPGHLPPNTRHQAVNGPAFTLGSAEDSGFLQGVDLAVRLVSPCAGLPEGISNMMGSAISASAAFRFAWDQWAAMSDSASEGELTDCPDKHDKEKAEKAPANARHKSGKTAAAATVGRAQLPTVAVALGAMACLTPAAAQSVTEVADAETLGKIGRDPNYPLTGHYRQSSDIDGSALSQSIGNHSHPFTGQYDGQCHTIANLQRCLVQAMKDGGRVDSLRFTGANINSNETAGVVACEILDDALASNIQVEDAFVATRGEEKFAGIGAGYVRGAVTNMTVVNGTVMTSGAKAHAGISAGKLEGKNSTVTGTGALNCKVSVIGERADAGIGAGHVLGGTVNHTMVAHSRVEVLNLGSAGIGAGNATIGTVAKTTAAYCHVKGIGDGLLERTGLSGIGVGLATDTDVFDTVAVHCQVEAKQSDGSGIGVGVSRHGKVARVVSVNSNVSNTGRAAIGVGVLKSSLKKPGTLDNTTSVNSTVSTKGVSGHAGIGVGAMGSGGILGNTTGVKSRVLTSGAQARGAVGAGAASSQGKFEYKFIGYTLSVDCEIVTSGSQADAGIGVGYIDDGGIVIGTTGLSSKVLAKGGGQIGIGAGKNQQASVNYSRAIDCTLEDSSSGTAIDWGVQTERCNVRVNGKEVQDTPFGCAFPLDNLCKHAAPGLVDADCKPNNRLLMDIQQALKNIRHSHPLQPDFLNPQQVTQFGVCWTRPLPPTDKVTGANNTVPMNFSTPTSCCPPATAAPLAAAGLSGGAAAGIALGVLAACALVTGGAYVYYRYNRSDNSEGKEPVSPKDSELSRPYDIVPT